MKKYIELAGNGTATHIKIELRYNLGGFNCFTYTEEKRGYYLHVSPVTRENRNGYTMESFTAFSGVKQLIKPVSRKSAKAERDAETAALQIEKSLISWVCQKNGLPVPEVETV